MIVLGDAFYDKCTLITKIDNIKDLYENIVSLLEKIKTQNSDEAIYSYFQNLWDESYIGDIYFDDENYDDFTTSIMGYLNEQPKP